MWPMILDKLLGDKANGLILSLDNGDQISVQQILQFADSLVVVRGRWAGSSESGWTFLIPCERIVCCCFPREVPDDLLDLIQHSPTANTSPPAVPAEGGCAPQTTECAPQTAECAPPPGPETAPDNPLPPGSPTADTTLAQRLQELRQRLRQRLGQAPQTS